MAKRRPRVLAQKNFQEHRHRLESMDLSSRFSYICDNNLWGSEESLSGLGSSHSETEVLRREIPALLRKVSVSSLLDVPCGDFSWMRDVDLSGISYVGGDIVTAIVETNNEKFCTATKKFLRLDLTTDQLPPADLVLCRDCLVHLSYANIDRAIANIKRSGATWILTTHFLRIELNADISDGDWRPLNLMKPPFNFPEPDSTILEDCQEGNGAFDDKALALWRVADLPAKCG